MRRWNRFFFEPVDPLPVAAYRILFGLLTLGSYGSLLPQLLLWYGKDGVLTHETSRILTGTPRLDLLSVAPSNDAATLVFFGLFFLCVCALTVGFRTRAAAIGTFLGLVTIHHRNILILAGEDVALRLMCFFMIFSHAGDAWSVDAWRKKKARSARSEPWAQRLMQLQLALIYITTAVSKASAVEWPAGTAMYYTSRLQDFWRFPIPYVFEHLWTIKLFTWSVLAVEFAIPVFLWLPKTRRWAIFAGLALHAGIEYAMNIPFYSFAMMISYVLFLEPGEIRAIVGAVPGNAYPRLASFAKRAERFFARTSKRPR